MEKRERMEQIKSLPTNLENLKQSLTITPVLAFVEKFDVLFKKKQKSLKQGEVLFSPGDNPYFYVVAAGTLRIFQINPTGERKEVGVASRGSFLGEGVISDRTYKGVEAVSDADHTIVIPLTKADLEYLESMEPEVLAKLYKHIMDITSQRLAAVNKELASLSEMTEKINDYKEAGESGLKDAIVHLKNLLSMDYVTLVEEHPAVPGMLVYKQSTNSETPLKIAAGNEISLSENGQRLSDGNIPFTEAGDRIQFVRLENGANFAGYLILGRKKGAKSFSLAELRVSNNLAPHFTAMLLNSQKIEDERARAMKDSVGIM